MALATSKTDIFSGTPTPAMTLERNTGRLMGSAGAGPCFTGTHSSRLRCPLASSTNFLRFAGVTGIALADFMDALLPVVADLLHAAREKRQFRHIFLREVLQEVVRHDGIVVDLRRAFLVGLAILRRDVERLPHFRGQKEARSLIFPVGEKDLFGGYQDEVVLRAQGAEQ